MKIGIIGLGLMGGSFAKALKKYSNHKVLAFDINKESLNNALSDKAIDEILDLDNLDKLDLTILALRPKDAINFAKENSNLTSYVMDFCGVKNEVSKELLKFSKLNDFTYIGGHPMAGREVGGYENSLADLYQNRSILIISHGDFPDWIRKTFMDVGFSIKETDDETHDKVIAYTSQLCHITSNAITKSPNAINHKGFSADSLKDLTRVATIDEEMWTELFFINRENLLFEIDNYIKELEKYKKALEDKDSKKMKELLKEGKILRAKMYPKEEEKWKL